MLIRTLNDILGTSRDQKGQGWQSRRLLTSEDRSDFSFHDTVIAAGARIPVRLKGQFEVVYVLEGYGAIESENSTTITTLEPGVLYTVSPDDPHVLVADTEIKMICIFTPACSAEQVAHES